MLQITVRTILEEGCEVSELQTTRDLVLVIRDQATFAVDRQ
ncbi:hypothetical protein [Mesorhizobium sp. NFR06]|nr:hypothetical protein [Mesorhizobium sp. NFR06]